MRIRGNIDSAVTIERDAVGKTLRYTAITHKPKTIPSHGRTGQHAVSAHLRFRVFPVSGSFGLMATGIGILPARQGGSIIYFPLCSFPLSTPGRGRGSCATTLGGVGALASLQVLPRILLREKVQELVPGFGCSLLFRRPHGEKTEGRAECDAMGWDGRGVEGGRGTGWTGSARSAPPRSKYYYRSRSSERVVYFALTLSRRTREAPSIS